MTKKIEGAAKVISQEVNSQIGELGLSEEQLDVVQHIVGPMLVISGAGSGKTCVIVSRISNMILKGIAPDTIVAITFTNKAANEMKRRVESIVGQDSQQMVVSTFHSFGLRILRIAASYGIWYEPNHVYDNNDSEKLVEMICKDMGLKVNKKIAANIVSKIKNTAQAELHEPLGEELDIGGLEENLTQADVVKLYKLYETQLRLAQAVDFDDLIKLPFILCKQHPKFLDYLRSLWKYILVDEYQDTNILQALLVKAISGNDANVCVVGDPNQSIYSWRGASISNIENFILEYPTAKIYRLNTNYRCATNIVQAANAVISQGDTSRWNSHMLSYCNIAHKGEVVIVITERDIHECDIVISYIHKKLLSGLKGKDCAILYRANFQSRVFEDGLMKVGMAYKIYGSISFYQRKEIKDMMAFVKVALSNGKDFISLTRVLALYKMGIGPASTKKLVSLGEKAQVDFIVFIEDLLSSGSKLPIRLSDVNREKFILFVQDISRIRDLIWKGSLVNVMSFLINNIRILSMIVSSKEIDEQEEALANIKELLAKAKTWESEGIEKFLEEMSMRTEKEFMEDKHDEAIILTTLHNAKGLEFDMVVMVGMEEDLLPYSTTARQKTINIEEERRLCYVGMTRAKRSLILSLSKSRMLWGIQKPRNPSRFILDIIASCPFVQVLDY